METKTTWTNFWDMHSGGGRKEDPYEQIYIEAPEKEATIIFNNRFGHDPHKVFCKCCGENYSISEGPTLQQLTAYHRGCKYDSVVGNYVEEAKPDRDLISLEDFCKQPDILIIYSSDIKPEERIEQ